MSTHTPIAHRTLCGCSTEGMEPRAAKPTSQKATIADQANSYSRKVMEKAKLREEHKATEAEAMMVRVGSIGAGVLASMSTRDDDIATYSADELAELLRVNRKTIYEAAGRGDIPHRRLGRRLIFERGSVLGWLRQSSAISEPKRGRDER